MPLITLINTVALKIFKFQIPFREVDVSAGRRRGTPAIILRISVHGIIVPVGYQQRHNQQQQQIKD
jgi:hypothetical protein